MKRDSSSFKSMIELILGLFCLILASQTTHHFIDETWRWNHDPFPLVPSVLYSLGVVLLVSNGLRFYERMKKKKKKG